MNSSISSIRVFLLTVMLLLSCLVGTAQEGYAFPEDIKPLIQTQWGQHHPFNLLCPKKDSDETVRMLAGCGPVAMAQMVNYHRYPSMSPDGRYTYDWELMFKTFHQGLLKDEVVAVAKLISDCGVSSFTSYGEKGSTTSISLLMGALKRLFHYSDDMSIYEREKFATAGRDSLFRQLIFSELKAGRPVIYRGYSKKDGSGHLFIIDGCRKRKVHVNFGWAGHRNGYYDLDDLDGYSEQQWLLVDVADSTYHSATKEVTLNEPGKLGKLLDKQQQLTTRHIKLSGQMDGRDFATLRDMLQTGMLRTINMEEVDMEALPDSAFYECTYLSHFVAPRSLKRTGTRSFYRCRNLNHVVFHEGLRAVSNATFSGCTNLLSLQLPTTTTMIGHNAFTSCEALLTVTLPEATLWIGNYAFSYCHHLYGVSLPKSLSKFGKDVFLKCERLTHLRLSPENSHFTVNGKELVPNTQTQEVKSER